MMTVARLKGVMLAESNDCIRVDGNYYFPPESVKREYLWDRNTHPSFSGKDRPVIVMWKSTES